MVSVAMLSVAVCTFRSSGAQRRDVALAQIACVLYSLWLHCARWSARSLAVLTMARLTLAVLTMAILTMATLCQVVSAVESADDRFLDAAATADGAALRRALRDGARVDATDARKAP